MQLICPACRVEKSGSSPMLEHLVAAHGIGRRRAKFVTEKLVEWKVEGAVLMPRLRMMMGPGRSGPDSGLDQTATSHAEPGLCSAR
jgi:hypothetical protein